MQLSTPASVTGIAPSAHEPPALDLAAAIDRLHAVTLVELDQAQLHDRVESKVILRTSDIPRVLMGVANEYAILEHAGQRLQRYRTEYFDTSLLRNYHEHHNQKRSRLKLRYRTYVNSDLTFFEVKRNVDGRTVKERRPSKPPRARLWNEDAEFFTERTGWETTSLQRSLTVEYDRILLVKRDFSERVTIDLNLTFTSPNGSTEAPGLAICEFKQPKLNRRSPAIAATRTRPQKFSKYCMGLASCDPDLRRNRFKKVFRNLESMDAAPTNRKLAV